MNPGRNGNSQQQCLVIYTDEVVCKAFDDRCRFCRLYWSHVDCDQNRLLRFYNENTISLQSMQLIVR